MMVLYGTWNVTARTKPATSDTKNQPCSSRVGEQSLSPGSVTVPIAGICGDCVGWPDEHHRGQVLGDAERERG